ncbi:YraN family protein [Pelagibaculum spongiae]|uniref:UPF0102 protein DC094_02345 n=1 Tax=Pelagibaculum spongiae TaxID=2080658 RepID=A0A2V1H014_9GAMM|nr:YraN family protein [Pelagibaculum spongiae]
MEHFSSLRLWQKKERQAERFLIEQGLKLLGRNFHCKHGEIDLIMKDRQTLVFVEVRYRNNSRHGSPAASVSPSKQNKIRKSAQIYLQRYVHRNSMEPRCRFDVISLQPGKTNWLPGAF